MLWAGVEHMSSMVIISSVCYLILCASVALLPTVGRAQRGGGTVWAKKGVAASVLGAPLRLAPAYGLGSRAFMPTVSVFVQTAPREKAGFTLSTSSSICFQRLLPLLD